MNKLLLPLKHYDDAGRVKPPALLGWCVIYLARSLVILAIALTPAIDADAFLSLLYPLKRDLFMGLALSLPALLTWAIYSFREKWWSYGWQGLFLAVKPLLYATLMVDLWFSVYLIHSQHWQFNWMLAVSLLASITWIYWVAVSNHLKIMLTDWRDIT